MSPIDLLTPEGILQKAADALQAELKELLKEKKTVSFVQSKPRDIRVCDLTIGICILEHAAEILIRPEDFDD